MTSWSPYRPPWYPADLPAPFAMNGETGSAARTNYEAWVSRLAPGELERLVAEHRTQVESSPRPRDLVTNDVAGAARFEEHAER